MMRLTEEQKEFLKSYPIKELTRQQLRELPEYSFSEPTLTIGKRYEWSKRTPFDANEENAIWFYGEYVPKQGEKPIYDFSSKKTDSVLNIKYYLVKIIL